jgi:prephenate dehydrogenase
LPENDASLVARAQAAWEAVGCRVVTMSPEAHDHTFAAVSHLPHLLAFAYMQGLMGQGQDTLQQHLAVAGPGFRDFSRIAGSTSAIWRDIFSANRDEVLAQLAMFEGALAQFKNALAEGRDEDLARLVDEASAVRSSWPR